jgi:hypothetical protein
MPSRDIYEEIEVLKREARTLASAFTFEELEKQLSGAVSRRLVTLLDIFLPVPQKSSSA